MPAGAFHCRFQRQGQTRPRRAEQSAQSQVDLKLAADTLADTNQLELRVFANEAYRQAVLVARLDNLGKGNLAF